MLLALNNYTFTIPGAVDAADTDIPLSSGAGAALETALQTAVPANTWFSGPITNFFGYTGAGGSFLYLTLTSTAGVEIVRMMGFSDVDQISVVRARQGTTALDHPAGAEVTIRVTAAGNNDFAKVVEQQRNQAVLNASSVLTFNVPATGPTYDSFGNFIPGIHGLVVNASVGAADMDVELPDVSDIFNNSRLQRIEVDIHRTDDGSGGGDITITAAGGVFLLATLFKLKPYGRITATSYSGFGNYWWLSPASELEA